MAVDNSIVAEMQTYFMLLLVTMNAYVKIGNKDESILRPLALALVKLHTITPLLILHKIKILGAQAKRLQNPIPQLLELPHHLAHLVLLRLVQPRPQSPQLPLHAPAVQGREQRR